jgi:DNA-binding MarR family transcriptional regulator
MTSKSDAASAITHIRMVYPKLSDADAVAFLCVCAEDGLSLKALSQRLGAGQSTATRHVSALESCISPDAGLVRMSRLEEGAVRRTVRLTPEGRDVRESLKVESP